LPSNLLLSDAIRQELLEFNQRRSAFLKFQSHLKAAEIIGCRPAQTQSVQLFLPQWPDPKNGIPFMAKKIDFWMSPWARILKLISDGSLLRFLQVSTL
jgi:hypothetical protein